jgi:hypothetical protein
MSKLKEDIRYMEREQRKRVEQWALDRVTASLQGNERKMMDISETARSALSQETTMEKKVVDVERRVMRRPKESAERLTGSLLREVTSAR